MLKLLFLGSLVLAVCEPRTAYHGAQDRARLSHRIHKSRRRNVDDDAVVNVIARKVNKVGLAMECNAGNCSTLTSNGTGPDQPFWSRPNISAVNPPPILGINPQNPSNVYSTSSPLRLVPPPVLPRSLPPRCASRSTKTSQPIHLIKPRKPLKRSVPSKHKKSQRRRRCCCKRTRCRH